MSQCADRALPALPRPTPRSKQAPWRGGVHLGGGMLDLPMELAPAVLAWEPAACSTKVDQTMPQCADRALQALSRPTPRFKQAT